MVGAQFVRAGLAFGLDAIFHARGDRGGVGMSGVQVAPSDEWHNKHTCQITNPHLVVLCVAERQKGVW